jgi:Secretion system C-terminal sorting domain/FG-GAP repeat
LPALGRLSIDNKFFMIFEIIKNLKTTIMQIFTQFSTSLRNFLICTSFLLVSTVIFAQWTQVGLDIDGEAAGDQSGTSVSMSADGLTLAIGAIGNDGNGSAAGQVRVYSYNGSAWVQQGADIDGEAPSDQNGFSVSISANGLTLAIGAPLNDGNGDNAGHVRVYSYNGSAWVQQGADIDGEASGDNSGWSVSMSADGLTLAIGATLNDGNGSAAGHVRMYSYNGSAWVQQGADIDGEAAGDQSGFSVSMSADGLTLAIGAPGNDGNGSAAGHVRVYSYNGSAWVQQGADIDGELVNDQSGNSVSMSVNGLTLAIGAAANDGNGFAAGQVRVYSYNGSAWVQQGADIDGEAAGDQSGFSVSMSVNGLTLAIGARWNDGNGTEAGQARVYSYNGSAWVQQGADIDGEAVFDESGWSASMSADGSKLAIGANVNDGNGFSAGQVRVYAMSALGINEANFRNTLKIFPNPSTRNFYVDFGATYKKVKVVIIDITGKLIQSNTFNNSKQEQIDLEVPVGIYFLKIEAVDKKVVLKLIIK